MLAAPTAECFAQIGPSRQPLGSSGSGQQTVQCMSLCSTMDLLALALEPAQEVTVVRLDLQRLWTRTFTASVNCLAWRGDGKMLAVGCSDGCVYLVDVETGKDWHCTKAADRSQLHTTTHIFGTGEIRKQESRKISIEWVQFLSSEIAPTDGATAQLHVPRFQASNYLRHMVKAKNTSLSRLKTKDQIANNASAQRVLHLLMFGDDCGSVHFLVNGILSLATVSMDEIVGVRAGLSAGLSTFISLGGAATNGAASVSSLYFRDTSIFCQIRNEIFELGQSAVDLELTMRLLSDCLDSLAKEHKTIVALNDRLVRRLENVLDDQGAETATPTIEFMTLLATGVASPALVYFLAKDLGFKGLSKWIKGVEAGYTEIQKLLGSTLQPALQQLLLYLSDLLALSKWKRKYATLGLDEQLVRESVNIVTCFLVRAEELQTTISAELANFVVFYRWLTDAMGVIIGDIPADMQFPSHRMCTVSVVDYIKESLNRDSLLPFLGESSSLLSNEGSADMLLRNYFACGGPANLQYGLSNLRSSADFAANDSVSSMKSGHTVHYRATLYEIMVALNVQLRYVFGRCEQSMSERLKESPCIALNIGNGSTLFDIYNCGETSVQVVAVYREEERQSILMTLERFPISDRHRVIIVGLFRTRAGDLVHTEWRFSVDQLTFMNGAPLQLENVLSLQCLNRNTLALLFRASGQDFLCIVNLENHFADTEDTLVEMKASIACYTQAVSGRLLKAVPNVPRETVSVRLAVDGKRQLAAVLTADRKRVTIYDLATTEEQQDDDQQDVNMDNGDNMDECI